MKENMSNDNVKYQPAVQLHEYGSGGPGTHDSAEQRGLPTLLQSYIHTSRYARWLDSENRRETWTETVDRYASFFENRFPTTYPKARIAEAISNLHVMPSMRSLMTAGPALDRDEMASYNCAAIAIDNVRAFDEILYVLMCFHPDTMVVTRSGDKRIADIVAGDEVLSLDESTGAAVWKRVINHVKTKSSQKPKVQVTLSNGHAVKCTADHKWLTSNRGWVEASELRLDDDLVAPGWRIYSVTNTVNGKVYIGQTTKEAEARFKEHQYVANHTKSDWHFAKALRKYDASVWKVVVVDFAFSEAEAHAKEQALIHKLGTATNGYNSTTGGEGAPGYKWSDEQRLRHSENAYARTEEHREAQRLVIAKNQPRIIETRKTPEYREAQRQRNLGPLNPAFGKKHTPERIAQLSAQSSGVNNPFYGKKHTEETISKIKAAKAASRKVTA